MLFKQGKFSLKLQVEVSLTPPPLPPPASRASWAKITQAEKGLPAPCTPLQAAERVESSIFLYGLIKGTVERGNRSWANVSAECLEPRFFKKHKLGSYLIL